MIRDVLNQTVSPLDGTFLAETATDILPGLNLRLNDAFAGIGFHDSFRWNCRDFMRRAVRRRKPENKDGPDSEAG
jgi:hypothetical protein